MACLGAGLLPISPIAKAMAVGLLGYGLSLVLFVLALREIGAARTGAYFGTAPFIGAVIGLIVLRETMTMTLLISAVLMSFEYGFPSPSPTLEPRKSGYGSQLALFARLAAGRS